jgi:hypothetical protein
MVSTGADAGYTRCGGCTRCTSPAMSFSFASANAAPDWFTIVTHAPTSTRQVSGVGSEYVRL